MNARGASVRGACAAWILSAAPFFLDASAFQGVSRAALAAVPWIAYAGLPRRDREDAWAGVAFEIALFAPTLALGAWVDRASGMAGADSAVIAGGSALSAVLSSCAARECARGATSRALYTAAWFTLVAGLPILLAALVLGGASAFGPAPGWLLAIARTSPLQWALARLPLGEGLVPLPFAPLALLAALFLLGVVSRPRGTSEAAV